MDNNCPNYNQRNSAIQAPVGPAAGTADFIYCQRCGQRNEENSFKCTKCGLALHGPAQPKYIITNDNTMGGLIPSKNPLALWAYYLGVFSLIPLLGLLICVPALVTGILGLRYGCLHPEAKGKIHAWAGIILGGLCAAGYILIFVLPLCFSR